MACPIRSRHPGHSCSQVQIRFSRHTASDVQIAAVGEGGRPANQARPILLAPAGRESSAAAPVWKHGAAAKGNQTGRTREGMERCPRDDLKRQQFLVFPDQEKTGLAPSCPAGVAPDRKDEKTAPTEARGSILARSLESKMEILVEHIWPRRKQGSRWASQKSEVPVYEFF